VGGSVPVFDEVVISTSRLNAIKEFDSAAGILTVEAGCILETLDKFLQDTGFMMPLGEIIQYGCSICVFLSVQISGPRELVK
jgi:FAD/FMN-containing dehydrogenase